ncbi:MAG: hypothetical protein ACOYXC_10180 [Candidatus Rifleibacteriota bacterium]
MDQSGVDSSGRPNSLWYFLLLGFFGMCFSEILIWNTRTISLVFNRGIIPTFIGISIVWFFYTVMMSWFVDLVIRQKVDDTIGLLLLGNLYGLINEGFFAQNLYSAPAAVLGISPLFLIWPTLSWHPIIVALPTWYLFKSFVYRRLSWAPASLSLWQSVIVVLISGFWFSWQHAKWQQMWFPSGIELKIQFLFLMFPLLACGLLLFKTLRLPVPVFSEGLFTVEQRRLVWIFLALAGINNLRLVPVKSGSLTVVMLMVFYWLLFQLSRNQVGLCDESAQELELRERKRSEHFSNPDSPHRLRFPTHAYFQFSFLVVSAYVVFQLITLKSGLKAVWASTSMVVVFFALIFSAGLPFFLLFRFFILQFIHFYHRRSR